MARVSPVAWTPFLDGSCFGALTLIDVNQASPDNEPHWTKRWVWPAITFVLGGILSPLLLDASESAKMHFLGIEVSMTDERSVGVVGRDGGLVAPYQVTETGKGKCKAGSLVMGYKANAFRCGVDVQGNSYVADPCFAMDDGRAAACITGPWDHAGVCPRSG